MPNVGGLGDDAPDGWVLEQYEVPLPKGRGQILAALEAVLRQSKVQSIKVELGKPIAFTRFVREADAQAHRQREDEGGMTLGETARNVMMEEYLPKNGDGSKETFIAMLLAIAARRLHLTHIGVGVETKFFDWLHLDRIIFGGIENIAGVELRRDREIPDDNMIFFAGPQKGGRLDQSTYALKCHLLVVEETDEQEDAGQDLGGRDHPEGGGGADGAVEDGAGGDGKEGRPVRSGKGRGSRRRPRAAKAAASDGDDA